MHYVLADTGVWYAMFDPGDQRWGQTAEKEELLELFNVVIPWPTMYETLRTRMVKNIRAMQRFEDYLKRPNLTFIDDTPYREDALDLTLKFSLRPQMRPIFKALSMIDCLIWLILEDANVNISYLATFNDRDFRDVCSKRRIEMF